MQRYSITEENDGLLLQFIFKELQEFNRILKETKTAKPLAIALAGKSLEDMRIFSWSVEKGPLTQLRYYASLLAKKEVSRTPALKLFEKHLSILWILILRGLDPSFPKKGKKHDLLIAKINQEGELLMEKALLLAELYAKNENVLFYLVRHEKQLIPLLEKGALKRFFIKIFFSLEAAKAFIISQYKKRAFDELMPQINRCFQELCL